MDSRIVGIIAQFVGVYVAWRFAGTHPSQEQVVLFILLSVLGVVYGLTMRATAGNGLRQKSDEESAPAVSRS